MTEWFKVPVLKTGVLKNTVGSNPTLSETFLAQLEEQWPSKPLVVGSSPTERRWSSSVG